jgi:ribonuclease T2
VQIEPAAPFDYYVLSLAWAPSFCADPANAAANPKECGPGRHTGFAVHGLWPEANEGKSPEACEQTKPVPKRVLNMMLPYMPTASLVQHEWAEHGTCSGLTPADYFTLVIQARVAVQLPVQITAIDEAASESPEQIEGQFAGANPSFPAKAFRTACRGGEFSEMHVCFDRNLKGRECTASAGECSRASARIRPPQ